jgi:hypothetical protein
LLQTTAADIGRVGRIMRTVIVAMGIVGLGASVTLEGWETWGEARVGWRCVRVSVL